MHYNIERYFNGIAYADIPEMKQFLEFKTEVMDARRIQPYRTEWRIAAPDLSIAGSIDFVGKIPDGSFVVMDWKRSFELDNKLANSFNKKAS